MTDWLGHSLAGRKAKDGRILNVYEYDEDFVREDHDSFKYSASLTNLWQQHIKVGYNDDKTKFVSESGYEGKLQNLYKKDNQPKFKKRTKRSPRQKISMEDINKFSNS